MSERYQIKGKLGRGGIGAVYRGYDTQLDRDVAIKRLLPLEETQLNQADTGSLSREASALAKFQHPNVVTIFGFEEDSDGPFVVTELINGENLKVTIEKGALSVSDFQEFVSQTLDAMIAAEQLNLLHRDIKPANLMLLFLPSGKFQVKILDFGLAKFSQTPSTQTLDHKGSFLGSIDYIAPEQIDRRPLDQRTDLYSLGCVCYFALTQKPPFEGKNMADTMKNHLSHNVIPINEIRPDLPEAIGAWVMRMISLRPSQRPKNATQAVLEFEQSKIGISPQTPGPAAMSETGSAPVARPQSQPITTQTSTQPTTRDGRKILTQPMVEIPDKKTAGTQTNQRKSAGTSKSPPSKNKSQGLTGPYIGLGVAAALFVALIIYLIGMFNSGEAPGVEAAVAPSATNDATVSSPPPPAGVTEEPETNLPTPNSLPPAKPTAAVVKAHQLPVSSEQLAGHYVASEMVYQLDQKTPARPGDRIGSWGNFVQPEAGSDRYLARNYSDKDGSNCPRLVLAGPSQYPTLKGPQKLLQFDLNSSLQVPTANPHRNALAGTQTTVVIVFARTEGDGQVFRMRSNTTGNFIAVVPREKGLGVSFRSGSKTHVLTSKFAAKDDFVVATYRRQGNSNQLFVIGTDGKRYDALAKPTTNLATTFEVYNVGVTNNSPSDPRFSGNVAEVAIFNRALSEEEVQQMETHLLSKYFKSPSTQSSQPESGPVTKANTPDDSREPLNPEDRSTSAVPLPPVTEALVAHYSAQDWVFGEGFREKAVPGSAVHSWGNLAPNAEPGELLSTKSSKWIGEILPPVLNQTTAGEDPYLVKGTRFITAKTGHSLMLLGNSQYLENISETPLSIFMVVRSRPVEGEPNGRLLSLSGKLASAPADSNVTGFIGFNYNPSQYGISHKAVDAWKFVGAKREPSKFGIVCFQWDGPKGEALTSTRLATGENFESQPGPAPEGQFKIRNYSLGSNNNRPIDSDFAEVLIYNSFLDSASRDEIISWLDKRYFVK